MKINETRDKEDLTFTYQFEDNKENIDPNNSIIINKLLNEIVIQQNLFDKPDKPQIYVAGEQEIIYESL